LSISRVPLSALQSFRGTAYCFAREQSSSARGSGGIEGVIVVVGVVAEARRDDGEKSSVAATVKLHGRCISNTTSERRETGRRVLGGEREAHIALDGEEERGSREKCVFSFSFKKVISRGNKKRKKLENTMIIGPLPRRPCSPP
jgi:hypothetical protein